MLEEASHHRLAYLSLLWILIPFHAFNLPLTSLSTCVVNAHFICHLGFLAILMLRFLQGPHQLRTTDIQKKVNQARYTPQSEEMPWAEPAVVKEDHVRHRQPKYVPLVGESLLSHVKRTSPMIPPNLAFNPSHSIQLLQGALLLSWFPCLCLSCALSLQCGPTQLLDLHIFQLPFKVWEFHLSIHMGLLPARLDKN
ncbi:hypothetical protein CB1_001095021 [Camelus ferus]|nr:hypothetical protein CB1_001095021 [Camelus ferus]